MGVIHCPAGVWQRTISTDADLFLAIRAKAERPPENHPPYRPLFTLNYISVTNACNIRCPMCGAAAGTDAGKAVFLERAEIMRRARQVKTDGGRYLVLFGGEPTLHPDLSEIVGELSAMGLYVIIITNGVRLGREPERIRELKRRGLSKLTIQFDSLRSATLKQLGRDFLPEKTTAINVATAAGLSVGLVCMVTSLNAAEIGEVMDYAVESGHAVKTLIFACAADVGRVELDGTHPDREMVIRTIIAAGERHGLCADDILPLPICPPWGLQAHPDCAVYAILLRTPRGMIPLGRVLDMPQLHARLARCPQRSGFFYRHLVPGWHMLRSIRKGKGWMALRLLIGLIRGTRYSFLNIGIDNPGNAPFLDEERLACCSSAFYTSQGPVKTCLHFCMDANFPGSKAYEETHGSC